MAARKQYTPEDLQGLSRAKLNVVCVNRGINVSDETPDDDVRKMILAQQAQESATKEEATAAPEEEQPVTQPEPAPVSYPDEGEPENPEPSPPPKKASKAAGNERVWFRVSAGSAAHEKNDVFASLNGESVLIKRNHWVKLPKKFLAVFEHAIQTEFEMTEDDNLLERQVPRFNIQIRTIEQGLPPEKCRPV